MSPGTNWTDGAELELAEGLGTAVDGASVEGVVVASGLVSLSSPQPTPRRGTTKVAAASSLALIDITS
jgi:hypothetical protein